MRKRENNNIEEVINYCLQDEFDIADAEDRRLYLNCEVDEKVIDTLAYMIMEYNREDAGLPIEKRKPIRLYINSPGGSVYDGFGLCAAIKTSKTPVYTINQALCASMGFMIFIAGQKRFSMPYSVFLLHEGETFDYGNTSKVGDRIEFEKEQLGQMIKEYVVSNTAIDQELYEKNYRREWYFLPTEGKELGVVDHIIGVDCAIDDAL